MTKKKELKRKLKEIENLRVRGIIKAARARLIIYQIKSALINDDDIDSIIEKIDKLLDL